MLSRVRRLTDAGYPDTVTDKTSAVIVDLDGTLAHMGDRHPFATTGYDLDTPNHPVIEVVRALHAAGHTVLIVSGRKEVSRAETERWLTEHLPVPHDALHLRPDDDDLLNALNYALVSLNEKRVLEELYLRHFPIGLY